MKRRERLEERAGTTGNDRQRAGTGHSGLRTSLLRFLAFLNQPPKLRTFRELFVFGHRELRPEKEVANGVFVQNAVDEHPFRAALKVNPVIVGPVSVKLFSLTFDYAV